MNIYLLLIFGFAVRLINLNQSLWLDEAIGAKVVKTIPLFQIPVQFSPGDFHPPLYYMFMSFWSNIFGFSEISLRMPSVIFSLVAGWYVYKIGKEIKNKPFGLWSALFFLFNPLTIYYSQEVRMYMMATMLLSISLYYFLLFLKENKFSPFSKNIIYFNLFSALAMFVFYGSAFFIIAMIMVGGVCIISRKKGKLSAGIFTKLVECVGMTGGLIISLLILSPVLSQQIVNAQAGLADLKNWSMTLGKAEIKNVLMIFLKFATGRLSWYPKWSYYLVAGIPTVITWFFIGLGMKKNKTFAYLLILPLLFGIFVSFWAPMMMYFRFLYLLPLMSLLLSFGISYLPKSKNIYMGMAIILLVFSLTYLLTPQFHREDWKNLTRDIDSTQPVYMIVPSSDPVIYYNSMISLFEIRDIKKLNVPEHIQVIPYVEEIYGYSHTIELEKKGCIKETQSEYRGNLILEKWKCLRNA